MLLHGSQPDGVFGVGREVGWWQQPGCGSRYKMQGLVVRMRRACQVSRGFPRGVSLLSNSNFNLRISKKSLLGDQCTVESPVGGLGAYACDSPMNQFERPCRTESCRRGGRAAWLRLLKWELKLDESSLPCFICPSFLGVGGGLGYTRHSEVTGVAVGFARTGDGHNHRQGAKSSPTFWKPQLPGYLR